MGEVCAIRMFGPSHCFQRSQFASSSIRVRGLLQSLAPAPLVGLGSSMRRGKALPSASMPKDRRGTCAWRVAPYLPRCCMTSFCAPHPTRRASSRRRHSRPQGTEAPQGPMIKETYDQRNILTNITNSANSRGRARPIVASYAPSGPRQLLRRRRGPKDASRKTPPKDRPASRSFAPSERMS